MIYLYVARVHRKPQVMGHEKNVLMQSGKFAISGTYGLPLIRYKPPTSLTNPE